MKLQATVSSIQEKNGVIWREGGSSVAEQSLVVSSSMRKKGLEGCSRETVKVQDQ
jgi:hypothetical protein